MRRRDALATLAAPLLAPSLVSATPGRRPASLDAGAFRRAPARVVPVGGGPEPKGVDVVRDWQGDVCRARLVHRGAEPVRIQDVVLFDVAHALPPETRLYGEGFQMLSQTGGTLGQPLDLGGYTDARHYRMPMPADARTVYGLLLLTAPAGAHSLVAYTSCRRFVGQFRLREGSLQAVVDTEGLELKPGDTWELEELTFRAGRDREALLEGLARRLAVNHPPLKTPHPPTGWCSWYCFGAKVTARQVLDNLDFIATNVPGLRYIQIDDGYQPAMGDWLETGSAFGGNVQGVLKAIRERGFEPAIWIAPFVAEQGSNVFRAHPDWFVKDETGAPLASNRVTFGGWRRGPWYAMDGTHPDVQRHLETVCRTMREEWGVTYFKLDANFWGAIHGGHFRDPGATRIEAYRRGMAALLRGTKDAFVLGCNHPIWGSLGLVHGSRSSNDIKRTWDRVSKTARENLGRNWQNGRLWWNDPDAVCLTGDLGIEEKRFHATAIWASGGMLLSGDDLTQAPPESLELLKRLHPPTGTAARFADDGFRVGEMDLPTGRGVLLLNWDDTPKTMSVRAPGRAPLRELWTATDVTPGLDRDVTLTLPPRSGRVLVPRDARAAAGQAAPAAESAPAEGTGPVEPRAMK
jgi:alpha-galactosidase